MKKFLTMLALALSLSTVSHAQDILDFDRLKEKKYLRNSQMTEIFDAIRMEDGVLSKGQVLMIKPILENRYTNIYNYVSSPSFLGRRAPYSLQGSFLYIEKIVIYDRYPYLKIRSMDNKNYGVIIKENRISDCEFVITDKLIDEIKPPLSNDARSIRDHLDKTARLMATRDQLQIASSGFILLGIKTTDPENSGIRNVMLAIGAALNLTAYISHLSVPRSLKKAAKAKRL